MTNKTDIEIFPLQVDYSNVSSTPLEYWNKISTIINHAFKKHNIKMTDCYLVGSGIINQSIIDIEDVDSAIIIAGSFSNNQLLCIRNIIDRILIDIDHINKFHFRLFDEAGFRDLSYYDGYRLYEFQENNISFNNSNIIFHNHPILNSDNFCLSYLTQLVYDCIMNQDIFDFKIKNYKAEYRLKRNIEINRTNNIFVEASCINTYILLKEFKVLRENYNQSFNKWNTFLFKYFNLMKHEYTNKSIKYNSNLSKYLCHTTH